MKDIINKLINYMILINLDGVKSAKLLGDQIHIKTNKDDLIKIEVSKDVIKALDIEIERALKIVEND